MGGSGKLYHATARILWLWQLLNQPNFDWHKSLAQAQNDIMKFAKSRFPQFRLLNFDSIHFFFLVYKFTDKKIAKGSMISVLLSSAQITSVMDDKQIGIFLRGNGSSVSLQHVSEEQINSLPEWLFYLNITIELSWLPSKEMFVS